MIGVDWTRLNGSVPRCPIIKYRRKDYVSMPPASLTCIAKPCECDEDHTAANHPDRCLLWWSKQYASNLARLFILLGIVYTSVNLHYSASVVRWLSPGIPAALLLQQSLPLYPYYFVPSFLPSALCSGVEGILGDVQSAPKRQGIIPKRIARHRQRTEVCNLLSEIQSLVASPELLLSTNRLPYVKSFVAEKRDR
jgi:hypothetical protein